MASNKELKELYKQMVFPRGVFQVRNIVNGKIYVDTSVNLNAIWNRHRLQLSTGVHENEALQHDWNEYGEEAFIYEILSEFIPKDGEKVDEKKELRLLLEMHLEELQPYDEKGYNKRPRK